MVHVRRHNLILDRRSRCDESGGVPRADYANQMFIDSIQFYNNVDAILLPRSPSGPPPACLADGHLFALPPAGLVIKIIEISKGKGKESYQVSRQSNERYWSAELLACKNKKLCQNKH